MRSWLNGFELFNLLKFTIMKKEEIYNTIKSLARSEGCRWRLLYSWEEAWITEEALEELENMNFKSMLDVIMFLEWNY